MKTNTPPICLTCLLLLASFAGPLAAAESERALPRWFEAHRVQAHFENAIQDDLAGLYQDLHPAIRSMGAEALTRIFKTTAEGAWWPTAAGYTHGSLGGRDLGREIARHAHEHGLKTIAYYRIMCDDFVEKEHPEWLCRDAAGKLVLEPRTRRRPNEADRNHVICFNSPARAGQDSAAGTGGSRCGRHLLRLVAHARSLHLRELSSGVSAGDGTGDESCA